MDFAPLNPSYAAGLRTPAAALWLPSRQWIFTLLRAMSRTDQNRFVAYRTIERSMDRVFSARRSVECSLARIAELQVSVARAEEAIRRSNAVLAAHDPHCTAPAVDVGPGLICDAQLDVACRAAEVMRRLGYGYELFPDVTKH